MKGPGLGGRVRVRFESCACEKSGATLPCLALARAPYDSRMAIALEHVEADSFPWDSTEDSHDSILCGTTPAHGHLLDKGTGPFSRTCSRVQVVVVPALQEGRPFYSIGKLDRVGILEPR